MDNSYADYVYKRKKPSRHNDVAEITGTTDKVGKKINLMAMLLVGVFSAVIVFGVIMLLDFGAGKGGGAHAVTFGASTAWVVEIDSFTSKSEADKTGVAVRRTNAAGFVFSDNDYRVFSSIHQTNENAHSALSAIDVLEHPNAKVAEYTVVEKRVTVSEAHKETVQSIVDSFQESFNQLLGYLESFNAGTTSARDIATLTSRRANELATTVSTLEALYEQNPDAVAAKVLFYAKQQILALRMPWIELSGNNFAAVLGNSAATVFFAYYELSQ
jgi:hypothetical protein